MNREQLATYGALEFGPLLQQVYAGPDAEPAGGPVTTPRMQIQLELCLDQSYLLLGCDAAQLPDPPLTPAQTAAAPFALDYFLLRSACRALATDVDVRTADQEEKRSQRGVALAKQLDAATKVLAGMGYPVDGTAYAFGALTLDFLEPGYPWWYPTAPAVP
jgi:hypothetical protein